MKLFSRFQQEIKGNKEAGNPENFAQSFKQQDLLVVPVPRKFGPLWRGSRVVDGKLFPEEMSVNNGRTWVEVSDETKRRGVLLER